MQEHTLLGRRVEREAEEFAGALLVGEVEALEQGLVETWDLALPSPAPLGFPGQ